MCSSVPAVGTYLRQPALFEEHLEAGALLKGMVAATGLNRPHPDSRHAAIPAYSSQRDHLVRAMLITDSDHRDPSSEHVTPRAILSSLVFRPMERDDIGRVDEAIADSVGMGRPPDQVVPAFDEDLARE
jgi:hypothetical protein